jgi:hypothetical protein
MTFEHVPLNSREDTTVTVRPRGPGVYELSPYPFAASAAELGYAGRHIEPGQDKTEGGWPNVLAKAPTQWECFRLVAAEPSDAGGQPASGVDSSDPVSA